MKIVMKNSEPLFSSEDLILNQIDLMIHYLKLCVSPSKAQRCILDCKAKIFSSNEFGGHLFILLIQK